jgi:O-antigen biosynthesis protein WbqP
MYRRVIKRLLDSIVSFVCLIALSPLLLLLALCIKIDSRGPVFFYQKRVGIHKTYFRIWKFRTMRIDAPTDVPTHMLQNAKENITRLGGFLRKKSLDELPQLINILKGDMAFVGPRPALWNQFDLIELRDQAQANDVKPGLTGLAQIHGRDKLGNKEKAQYDGMYARNVSFKLDVQCVLHTIAKIGTGEGIVEGIQHTPRPSEGSK